MRPIKDVKFVLFIGYVVGYPLAVLPPIIIDPLLKTHPTFPSRSYPYAYICILIYALLLGIQSILLWRARKLPPLYLSVFVFFVAIASSLPIFLPELPHGNLSSVGLTMSFFSAFTIFVWSICREIAIDPRAIRSAGNSTFEYMKILFTFSRQAAFACVTLFGALFLASYATGFKFSDVTATDKSELFLLYLNNGIQVSIYAIYAIAGPVRYFFAINVHILSQFKGTALRLDRAEIKKHSKNRTRQYLEGSRGSPKKEAADDGDE